MESKNFMAILTDFRRRRCASPTKLRLLGGWAADLTAATLMAALLATSLTTRSAAQDKKVTTYDVGPTAFIFVTNYYGRITVAPSTKGKVTVTTTSYSDSVTLDNEQHGDRIELRSISNRAGASLVDYSVLVPEDAFIVLESGDGPVHAEGLRGDVILESTKASIEAGNVADAHLHVKTLSGAVHLSQIRNTRIDVNSISGNVELHEVTGSTVNVSSGRGQITYDGDPGAGGEYLFTSHSGDLNLSIPATANADIHAKSMKGVSEGLPDGGDVAIGRKNLLQQRPVSTARFVLRSFSGKIRIKRP